MDATNTVTVEIPSVITYTDAQLGDVYMFDLGEILVDAAERSEVVGKKKEVEAIMEAAQNRVTAIVVRWVDYGANRSMNDCKGSIDALSEEERRSRQKARYAATLALTWNKGAGGGARIDPLFAGLRAILQTKRNESAGKVAKLFKTRVDVVKAYGATQVEIWEGVATQIIALQAGAAVAKPEDVDVQEDD